MLSGIMNNRAMRVLTGALDGLSERQSAISSNIANAETPGYQRRTVRFEDRLRQEIAHAPLATTAPGHMGTAPTSRSSLADSPEGARLIGSRNDANTVDVEQEMTDLAETTIRYYAVADVLRSKLTTLRNVIERA